MRHILIIGGGSIGKRHLRNLLLIGENNLAVIEPSSDRAKIDIEDVYGIKTFRTIEQAFSSRHWDVVFICSPSIFHLEQALYCAENGCDLFIEKPLSTTLDSVDKLTEIVESRKLISMVGSNWKFHPLFKKMKQIIESGVLGRILSARCQFGSYLPDWHPWEDYRKGYSANKQLGGGILLDSHEFDYLSWFMGPVKKLVCVAGRVGEVTIDTEDLAEVVLQFKNGSIGEIHLDYLQRFYQRNFEFFGEQGTMKWDVNNSAVTLRLVGKPDEVFSLDKDYDINMMYVEQAKHFLEAVDKRTASITPLSTGAYILKLICAAKESAETNKFIVLN